MPKAESETGHAIALDAQVFTFLIQANNGTYDPARDTDAALAPERVAVFRVFLYYPGLILSLPTVAREVGSISDLRWKKEHQMFERVHFLTGVPLPAGKVDALAYYYHSLHSRPDDLDDCRIVAEAELSRVNSLLTYDFDLLQHLNGHTGYVLLLRPSWFWQSLKIPPGSPPNNWVPHASHPLAQATWWRW